MSVNPDLIPVQGELRFMDRSVNTDLAEHRASGVVSERILQQFQWSETENKFDWYDVRMV